MKAQLFAADGSRQGGEFRVNADAAGAQTMPSVASLDSGGFVVAWNANGDVKSQAFTAAGQRSGAEFTVDLPDYPAEVTSGRYLSDRSPEVADLPGPGYVLAWAFEDRSRNVPGSGIPVYNVNSYKVQAQVVLEAGTARSGVVDATDFMPFAGTVDVAGLTTGGFALAYTRTVDAGDGEFTTMIQTRDVNGASVVAARDSGIGRDPGLASVPTGGFALIAMPSFRRTAPPEPLRARIFNNAAEATGAGTATTEGRNPALAGSGRGNFLAAFEVAETVNGAAAGTGIRALLFNGAGAGLSGVIPINSVTAGDQVTPDAAFLGNGERAVIVWRDAATGAIKGQLLSFSPAV